MSRDILMVGFASFSEANGADEHTCPRPGSLGCEQCWVPGEEAVRNQVLRVKVLGISLARMVAS